MSCRRISLSLFLVLILCLTQLFAQVESGTINGTVKDSTGASVPNAAVTIRNIGTQTARTVQTSESGQYTVFGLAPGRYEVSVTSGNFAPYKSQVDVTVGGRLTVDPVLTVANAATTVEVVAEGGAQVNTQSQELSQVVSPREVAQLPSLTRNPYDFVQIAGNISGGDRSASGDLQKGNGGQNLTDRGVGYNINGQRAAGTEILLDGVENSDLFTSLVGQNVPIDSVQEFRVITNNFDAQYGRASGGVINVTTKTGTNGLHGSAWEFNRLSAYTANTVDNAQQGLPKGKYTRNQFGYAVGGPVIKDKLFFFNSTEWTRVRSNASLTALVPTPQLLALTSPNVQSYFSQFGGNLNFTRTLTKADLGTQVNRGGAFDTRVAAGVPAFGVVNFTAPTDAGGGLPQNTYRLLGRADYNLSDKTQMFVRYGLESIDDFAGSIFASPYSKYNVGDTEYNNAVLFNLNHIFSATVFSNTKLSFNRLNLKQSYDTKLQNTPTLFLSNNASIQGLPVQLPGFFDNSTGTGGLPFGGPQNVIQTNQDLSLAKGKHTWRFGGQYLYEQINRSFGAYAQAVENLGANPKQGLDNLITGNLVLFQAAVNPQGKFPCVRDANTGGLIASPSCTLTLPTGSPVFARSYRYSDWATYANDNFKVGPRLTLNLGVRYEHYGVQHNNNQQLDSNFYFGPGASFFQRVRSGSIQLSQNSPIGKLWNPNWGTVAPRIGFAYDLFGDGKTSLRGGYGISYERNFGNVTFNMIQNPPNYASVQLRRGVTVTTNNLGPLGGSSGTVLLPPSSPRHVDQNIDTAQSQFYSMAIEREVARNTLVALEYSGARGVHLYDIKNINLLGGGQVYLGDPFNPALGNYSRPTQQFTSINNRGSSGDSYYHALNVRLQAQNLHNTGISLTTNYTYAHSIDDLSSTFSESSSGSNGVGNLGYLDPRNPRLDRGSSDFDIRHRVVISAIWDEPFFKNSRGLLRQALGGYTIVPLFSAHTGIPFTVADSSNSLNAGAGTGIPRYVPAGTIASFFTGTQVNQGANNYNALTLPAGNSFSNAALGGISDFGPFPSNMVGRNAFRGPGAWNFDLAVSKAFAITEQIKMEFRAEGFNILNHHNFYVNGFVADVANFAAGDPVIITEKKGGLGVLANGGNHDERRFGQFAIRFTF